MILMLAKDPRNAEIWSQRTLNLNRLSPMSKQLIGVKMYTCETFLKHLLLAKQ